MLLRYTDVELERDAEEVMLVVPFVENIGEADAVLEGLLDEPDPDPELEGPEPDPELTDAVMAGPD